MIGLLLANGAGVSARSHDGPHRVRVRRTGLGCLFRRKSRLWYVHNRSMTLNRRAFLWASSICW